MSPRSPLSTIALLASALVSWTCTSNPAVLRAEPPVPIDGSGGGSEAPASLASAVVAAAAEPESEPLPPAEPPLLGDGMLGVSIGIHDPGGHAFDGLHAALRRAASGEGVARILVYGASHVASDWFTGQMRLRLQERFGDAGHGFVMPVHPWRTYRHLGVQVESSHRRWTTLRIRHGHYDEDAYGLGGVAVESSEPGAWGAVTAVQTRVSRYELYYWKQPGGGSFEVIIDHERVRRISTRASRGEAGYATFELPEGPHRFGVLVRGGGPVRIFGVTLERDQPGVVVDTLGINGSRVRSQLLWNDALYREHLTHRRPDLVVLAYGTNEAGDDDVPIARYEANVRRVVARLREVLPAASCLLIGPTDRPIRETIESEDGEDPELVVRDRPRTAQLIDVQRRVATDHGCGFFDTVAFMGGPMAMISWVTNEPPYASPDHIHFTRTGYRRLGDVVTEGLLQGYEEPSTNGAPAPAPTVPVPSAAPPVAPAPATRPEPATTPEPETATPSGPAETPTGR